MSLTPKLSELLDSDEIYIIFGGPSLKGFDFSRLDNKPTLGCNKVSEVYKTDCVISIDPTYINTRRDFLKKYDGYVALGFRGTSFDAPIKPNKKIIEGIEADWVYYHNKKHPHKISTNPQELYGQHTGHAAVNFAALHGFKTIHALGLDLCNPGHWHGGYTHSRQMRDLLIAWAWNLDECKTQLEQMDIKMINYNPDSGVRRYEFKTYEDIA